VADYPGQRILVHREFGTGTLGILRNVSVDLARGPLVCQWDDDDLYHPLRLAVQFDRLQATRSDFCFFTDQLHWFEQDNLLLWDDWAVEEPPMQFIQGTLMGDKAKLGAYPALERGEDTQALVDMIARGCRLAGLSGHGYLYVYVYNGKNTWDLQHHAAISAAKRVRHDRLMEVLPLLRRHLPNYGWPVKALSLPHDRGVLCIDAVTGEVTTAPLSDLRR